MCFDTYDDFIQFYKSITANIKQNENTMKDFL